jgi:hypothetical protein
MIELADQVMNITRVTLILTAFLVRNNLTRLRTHASVPTFNSPHTSTNAMSPVGSESEYSSCSHVCGSCSSLSPRTSHQRVSKRTIPLRDLCDMSYLARIRTILSGPGRSMLPLPPRAPFKSFENEKSTYKHINKDAITPNCSHSNIDQ